MSALAKILFEKGYIVSGSDIRESSNTIRLKDQGIKVNIGHDASYVRHADLVVFSTAIQKDNPEYIEALERHVTIWPRSEMLAWIMQQYPKRIAVAGTHGKTTTTSMIAQIFDRLGQDPTFLIGGETDYVDGNAKLGGGDYVIAEADESDGSFLKLSPTIPIITNIEEDHLEYYGSLLNIVKSFEEFARKVPDNGYLIINTDNQNSKNLLALPGLRPIISYGLTEENDFYPKNVRFEQRGSAYDLYHQGSLIGEVGLSIPGWQNVQNSLAAISLAVKEGLNFPGVVEVLRNFTGARRRFQLIGEVDGISVYDDYGHHPTEINATLEAAKMGWPDRRIICVFQPHRYSRTLHLKDGFDQAFNNADIIILTSIYAAGEAPIPGVNTQMLIKRIKSYKQNVSYIPKKESIPDHLMEVLAPGDILLVIGAGDINHVARETLNRLKVRENDKTKTA